MAVALAPFAASISESVSPPQLPAQISSPICKALSPPSSRFESCRTGKSSSSAPTWSGVRPAEILIRHEPICLTCGPHSGRSRDHGGGAHDFGRRRERLDKSHNSRVAKLGGKQRARRAGCGSESAPMGGRPVCLLPGVGGGLWEGGAESDGERFPSRKPSTPKVRTVCVHTCGRPILLAALHGGSRGRLPFCTVASLSVLPECLGRHAHNSR